MFRIFRKASLHLRNRTMSTHTELPVLIQSVLLRLWIHPILLNSTPEQTRAHRRSRSRDGKTDSAFTTMVLEIEQAELDRCAHKAKIILAKTGENLTYAQYRAEMEG